MDTIAKKWLNKFCNVEFKFLQTIANFGPKKSHLMTKFAAKTA